MKALKQKKLLRKLLLQHRSNNRLWVSLLALCVGTTLLLLAVMIWWNFAEVLSGKRDKDSLGSTFLTIGKNITKETMKVKGSSLFTPKEIEIMKGAPQVQSVGELTSNRFPVWAELNTSVSFQTQMFVEGVPDEFIDKKPDDWRWEAGSRQVPIIISSDFLNLYNYGFALSQNLPQLSPQTIQSLAFDLKIGDGLNTELYTAHIVGFSDRINSVLVPQSFIEYGNNKFAPVKLFAPSRLIVKVKDPSDKQFVEFLQTRDYTTNSEQLRWNKLRSVIDITASATGILAILLMGISTLVFILFIELTIAKAAASLSLLLQLGYSPRYLRMFMFRRFLPLIFIALALAMGIAFIVQARAAEALRVQNLELATEPGWPVWAALGVSAFILFTFVSGAIYKAMRVR